MNRIQTKNMKAILVAAIGLTSAVSLLAQGQLSLTEDTTSFGSVYMVDVSLSASTDCTLVTPMTYASSDIFADGDISIDNGLLTLNPSSLGETVLVPFNTSDVGNNAGESDQVSPVLYQSPGPLGTDNGNIYGLVQTIDTTEQPPSGITIPPIVPNGDSTSEEISPAPEPSPLAISLLSGGLILFISKSFQRFWFSSIQS